MCAKYLEYETKLIHLQLMRITPADAGKTAKRELKAAQKADHPRGCGENALGNTRITVAMGSPPRMRGKHSVYALHRPNRRITPADAGKTAPVRCRPWSSWDHPRRCGENSFEGASLQFASGSPPQVRGKQAARLRLALYLRITPADAGKTKTPRPRLRSSWDHPRVCGENFYSVGLAAYNTGSPPRMRGKRWRNE